MGQSSPDMIECRLQLPAAFADVATALDAAFADLAVATSVDEPGTPGATVIYNALFLNDVAQDDILARIAIVATQTGTSLTPDMHVLPPTDWLAVSYQAHPPLDIGRFTIYGAHDRPDTLAAGRIGLEIEAATAFGTGQHGTTSGCLLALQNLAESGFTPRRCIDVGTGSGILALAAHALWHCPVLATDIDAEAVRVTREHLRVNHVAEGAKTVAVCVADGADDTIIQDTAPYDCVIANILAGPLRHMAADLTQLVTPQAGRLILSGLLITQAADVMAAYTAQGCTLVRETHHGEWAALVLQRS
ncbi:MAG: 50S ribosomal protein L11 methyltransferase [Pseudomonadota bacterium]